MATNITTNLQLAPAQRQREIDSAEEDFNRIYDMKNEVYKQKRECELKHLQIDSDARRRQIEENYQTSVSNNEKARQRKMANLEKARFIGSATSTVATLMNQ